jgi:hypothetical protein
MKSILTNNAFQSGDMYFIVLEVIIGAILGICLALVL